MPPTQPASVLSLQEAPSRSRIRLPSNSYNPEVLRRRRPWWARKWNPESTQPSLSSTLAARAGPMRRDNCRRHLTEAGTVCATRNAVVHTDTSRHWKSKRKRLQSFTFDVYWCKILMGGSFQGQLDLIRANSKKSFQLATPWWNTENRNASRAPAQEGGPGQRVLRPVAGGTAGSGAGSTGLKSGRRCPTRDGGIRGRDSSTAALRAAAI